MRQQRAPTMRPARLPLALCPYCLVRLARKVYQSPTPATSAYVQPRVVSTLFHCRAPSATAGKCACDVAGRVGSCETRLDRDTSTLQTCGRLRTPARGRSRAGARPVTATWVRDFAAPARDCRRPPDQAATCRRARCLFGREGGIRTLGVFLYFNGLKRLGVQIMSISKP